MRTIQLFLASILTLLAIITLIAGVVTGMWHLYLLAIMSSLSAFTIFDSDKDTRRDNKQFKDLDK